MEFIRVDKDDKELIKELSGLATLIVRKHYDPILGEKQNTYMIEKFQSYDAISRQLNENYIYYLLKDEDEYIGFMGYYLKDDCLYLSKLYLLEEKRNKHYGRQAISFLEEKCLHANKDNITLNVNRFNYDSIKAYEAFGFIRIRQEDNDIGNSYYMNDYVYMKKIGGKNE